MLVSYLALLLNTRFDKGVIMSMFKLSCSLLLLSCKKQ